MSRRSRYQFIVRLLTAIFAVALLFLVPLKGVHTSPTDLRSQLSLRRLSNTTANATEKFILAPGQPQDGYGRFGVGVYWTAIVVQILVLLLKVAKTICDVTKGEPFDCCNAFGIVLSSISLGLLDDVAHPTFVGERLFIWDAVKPDNSTMSVLATSVETAAGDGCFHLVHADILSRCHKEMLDTIHCIQHSSRQRTRDACALGGGCPLFVPTYTCDDKNWGVNLPDDERVSCIEAAVQNLKDAPPHLAIEFFNGFVFGWIPIAAYLVGNFARLLFTILFEVLGLRVQKSLQRGNPFFEALGSNSDSDAEEGEDQEVSQPEEGEEFADEAMGWIGAAMQDGFCYATMAFVIQVSFENDCMNISYLFDLNSFTGFYYWTCWYIFIYSALMFVCVCLAPLFVCFMATGSMILFGYSLIMAVKMTIEEPEPKAIAAFVFMLVSLCGSCVPVCSKLAD